MEISGKVIAVLEPQTFVSQRNGNTYVTNVFVIETSGQYPKKIAFKVLGADRFSQMGIVLGHTYNVSFDVDSREWNGRWFTDCVAWRVQDLDSHQPAQSYSSQARRQESAPIPPQQEDDVPF